MAEIGYHGSRLKLDPIIGLKICVRVRSISIDMPEIGYHDSRLKSDLIIGLVRPSIGAHIWPKLYTIIGGRYRIRWMVPKTDTKYRLAYPNRTSKYIFQTDTRICTYHNRSWNRIRFLSILPIGWHSFGLIRKSSAMLIRCKIWNNYTTLLTAFFSWFHTIII